MYWLVWGSGRKRAGTVCHLASVRKCDFCDVQSIWPKYRYRSGENIALEMKVQNNKYGTKKFLFTDSLLNGSVKQLEDLYHMTFLGSAILLAWTDKIMQKERKH